MDGVQRVETMMTNEPKEGEFFQLRPDARRGGKGHGVVFENREALLTPPRLILKPKQGGFPTLRETPRLVYIPSEGSLPEDLEGGFSGYWLVSDRLRQVMEHVDPSAFVFADTDYRLPDGSRGPRVFLCDVVRTVDALDEDASELTIEISDDYEDGKYYDMAGGTRLAFKRDVLAGAHVFRLPFHGGVFCDRVFKDAVEAAGIGTQGQSDGLWFYDVVNR
ncbi:DUF1629 domain-containing protein [Xanthomonas campestris pv. campestris]|jgi:hypothetical protein|uniref:Immunity MXAN-0049 protein domain-containing protein n=1 Tax=Xanthomonas vesicatoria ATCC 35937 TaxID=925775 RepID=F0BK16_9XANT|nr:MULTISPECIES: DUF1629 domain-containing protein [Xanthomonas]MCC4606823.1 DUF1629 domain-containing protein [Xanthomonas campestris pv. zinniae]EGD07185.1 domain of unknown function (DUF1629) protein [Xanthomonas vesicatoria ATCC 35937]KTF34604.1 hypothetical protein LMG920_05405 [Xanthomonas vesicatoria]MCC8595779.1 DUF1629 domain-containing protein [Xanthomonas vesicatoria]MCC8607382.1 DUF1629 domain-containing protein [Xanthomonas vesicatoria]